MSQTWRRPTTLHTYIAAANRIPDQDPLVCVKWRQHVIIVSIPQLCANFVQFGFVKVFETSGLLADCESVRVLRQKRILTTRLR